MKKRKETKISQSVSQSVTHLNSQPVSQSASQPAKHVKPKKQATLEAQLRMHEGAKQAGNGWHNNHLECNYASLNTLPIRCPYFFT